MIKNLVDLKEEELRGKKVIVRVDFNVPVREGKVVNAYRIERAIPTIEFLRMKGARILLMSHIETPGVEHPSLVPVFEYIKEHCPTFSISFLNSCFSDDSKAPLRDMKDGEIILFENIRQYGEEKENNEAFSKSLATLGEMYVNDAFAVSHRMHASVVGIPKFLPSYAGLQLGEEIKNLNISKDIPRPFLFVLGGAKFETKLPLIQKFLDIADHVFIGGALANDLLKAKGYQVGKSVVSGHMLSLENILNDPKLIFPVDVVAKSEAETIPKIIEDVREDEMIMDIGPQTMDYLSSFVKRSKYILWNGPLGYYEGGFKDATVLLGEAIGSTIDVQSVIGGADTLAAIQELDLLDKFTFVSTGGGAMLDYLLEGTLVGIQALEK